MSDRSDSASPELGAPSHHYTTVEDREEEVEKARSEEKESEEDEHSEELGEYREELIEERRDERHEEEEEEEDEDGDDQEEPEEEEDQGGEEEERDSQEDEDMEVIGEEVVIAHEEEVGGDEEEAYFSGEDVELNEELGVINQVAELNSDDSEMELYETSPAFAERYRLCKHLSVFGECDSKGCECIGFRLESFTSRRSMFQEANGLADVPMKTECFTCGHKMTRHVQKIRELTIDEVDRLTDIIDDVESIHDIINSAHPFIAAHLLDFYKRALASLRLLNPNAIADVFRGNDMNPPFDRPSAEILMRHYLGANTPTDPNLSRPMYDQAGRFLTEFNKWRPPLPEFFHICHVDKEQYCDFLDRWTTHCGLPEILTTLTQHEPVNVFGLQALLMYARFLKRTSKDAEEDPLRMDQLVNDPMSSMEMRHFCRGFFRYLYDAKKRNAEKLRYIKPHLHPGFHWPIWDKIGDYEGGKIGPETRHQLKKMHKQHASDDRERDSGFIPHEMMMLACLQVAVNDKEKKKDTTKDQFLVDLSRGDVARNEEREGIISFKIVKHNDDELVGRENLVWLLQLQNVFSIQLPKMPKEYITRLVFDDRHRNLALVKKDKGVIGGICFRPFKEQGFCEIVFLALSANEQVKGYGTHMMNHLKEYMAQRCGIFHLLTFADEFATGYFTKQGFTEKLGIPKDKFNGFIKEYEGATLMGCSLNTDFLYTNFSGYARVARDLHSALFDVSFPASTHKVHGGIEHIFREHEKNSKEPLPLDKIPGMCGFDKKYNKPIADPDLDNKIKNIMMKLKGDAHSWPFSDPVNIEEVPEYSDYIQFPIDLSTISQRIREKYYIHERLFIGDLNRLFDNCYKFNGVETVYYLCGYKLNQLAVKLIKKEFPKSELQIIMAEWEPTYSE